MFCVQGGFADVGLRVVADFQAVHRQLAATTTVGRRILTQRRS